MITILKTRYSALKPEWKKQAVDEGLYVEPDYLYFLLYQDEALVAFSGFKTKKDIAHSKAIYVFPEHRKGGYGTALVEHHIKLAIENKCRVIDSYCLPPSLNLYHRLGFKTVRVIQKKDGTNTTKVNKILI